MWQPRRGKACNDGSPHASSAAGSSCRLFAAASGRIGYMSRQQHPARRSLHLRDLRDPRGALAHSRWRPSRICRLRCSERDALRCSEGYPPHYPAHALEYGAHTLTERRKQRARWLSTDERSGTLFEYRPVHCLHSHRFEEHVPGAAHQSDPPATAAAAAAAPLVSRATFKDTCCSPPETR